MNPHELASRALAVNDANLALGHDVFDADGGRFVRNTDAPRIYDANHVAGITASTPDEIDALLARVEKEFAHCGHRRFLCDSRTPPPFEARLLLDGYKRDDGLVFVLTGELNANPQPCDIRLIQDDAGWSAYADLKRGDWLEQRERISVDEPTSMGDQMAAVNRLKCPPVRYWLAYDDGRPVGFFSSWSGIDGLGQVEGLFVHPDYRKRGIATTLIAHCVADCRANGADRVVIVADPTDTPKTLYAAMGWVPVAAKHNYLKRLDQLSYVRPANRVRRAGARAVGQAVEDPGAHGGAGAPTGPSVTAAAAAPRSGDAVPADGRGSAAGAAGRRARGLR
jgi:ribosomal protein S18 acetylase RimI-like enzyme